MKYNPKNNDYKKPFKKKFERGERPKQGLTVEVRGDDITKALRILKKRMQNEGIFNEMRERVSFQTNIFPLVATHYLLYTQFHASVLNLYLLVLMLQILYTHHQR